MKVNFLILNFLFIFISMPVHARDNMTAHTIAGTELGIQSSSYKYEEEVNGAFFMSNQGRKLGLTWTATSQNFKSDWHAIWDFRYAVGNVEYKSASGTGNGVPDRLWDMRILFGKDYLAGGNVFFPYYGLAYRILYNDLRKLGSGGYRRESEYLYLPLGVTHRFMISDKSRFVTTLEYDIFLDGTQTSYLSDIDPGLNNIKNGQHKGNGYRLSATYDYSRWSLGLFYIRWKIADSDYSPITYYGAITVYSGLEPKNETKESGIQMRYRF